MRIYDQERDTKVDKITIFLTVSEASTLHQGIEELMKDPKRNHKHVNSDDFKKELTVCIYDPTALEEYGFHERAVRLIQEDS